MLRLVNSVQNSWLQIAHTAAMAKNRGKIRSIFSQQKNITFKSITLQSPWIFQGSFYLFLALNVICCETRNVEKYIEKFRLNQDLNGTAKIYSGAQSLGPEATFEIAWEIDMVKETISIAIIAETAGYVGFGLSSEGNMIGADMLIAGVQNDGTPYFADYHGFDNAMPIKDEHQDWKLLRAEESSSVTKLVISRKLDTCDNADFEITDETMHVIWALGATDEITYHRSQRGSVPLNFFLYSGKRFVPGHYKSFIMESTRSINPVPTEHWCTMHELPEFRSKQHIVAFDPTLDSIDVTQHHIREITIHRCIAPKDQSATQIFQPWTTTSGDNCYNPTNKQFPFEMYCKDRVIFAWARGGRLMVLPEHVGIPIQIPEVEKEYLVMEVHYDNPDLTHGPTRTAGGTFYYTNKLRPNDAGLLRVGHVTGIELTIPPDSEDFLVAAHCSPECTENVLPPHGINIFSSLLHTHLLGKTIGLRHFRGPTELEWIDRDNFYNYNYQQNKRLPKEVKVLPGDQLTLECHYQSGENAVVGGIGGTDEACKAWLYYWPKEKLLRCESMMEEADHLELLGIKKWRYKQNGSRNEMEIFRPEALKGSYVDAINKKIKWTNKFRRTYQVAKQHDLQKVQCVRETRVYLPVRKKIQYPVHMEEYVQEERPECIKESNKTTTEKSKSTEKPASGADGKFMTVGLIIGCIFVLLMQERLN